MGWSYAQNIDFSGYQMELSVLVVIFAILALWVFHNADRYFDGFTKHLFWIITFVTGPVGLIIYLIARKRAEY